MKGLGAGGARHGGDLATLYAGRAAGVVVAIAFLPYYNAALGPSQFGVVALLLSLQALLVTTDFGISAFVARELADRSTPLAERARLVRAGECGLAGVQLALLPPVLFGAAFLSASSFGLGEVTACWVMFLALVLQNLFFAALSAAGHFRAAGAGQSLGVLLRALATVAAFETIGPTLAVFVAVQALCSVLHWIVMRELFLRATGARREWREARPTTAGVIATLKAAAPLALTSFAGAAVMNLDKTLVSLQVSTTAMAPYYLAGTLSLLPISVLAGPVSQFYQTHVIRSVSSGDGAQAVRVVRRFVLTLAAAVLVPSWVLWLSRHWVVEVWLGAQPGNATVAEYVGILLPGCALGAFGFIPHALLLAARDFRFQALASMTTSAITLCAVAVAAASPAAVEGVCYVYLAYHIGSAGLLWARAGKLDLVHDCAVASFSWTAGLVAMLIAATLALQTLGIRFF